MSISQNSRKRKRNESVKRTVNIEVGEKRYSYRKKKEENINRTKEKKLILDWEICLYELIVLIKYHTKLIMIHTFGYVKNFGWRKKYINIQAREEAHYL